MNINVKRGCPRTSSTRQRLGKFLLRHGKHPEVRMANWGLKHLEWIKPKVHFDQPALEATLQDYMREVEHAGERISRIEKSIVEAMQNTGRPRDAFSF